MKTIETVTNKYGKQVDFESAVNHMDDDLREDLHNSISGCTAQEFFDAYSSAHENKFGEEWIADCANPVW